MGRVRWALALGFVAAGCEVEQARAARTSAALSVRAVARTGAAVVEVGMAGGTGPAAGRLGGAGGDALPRPTLEGALQVELLEDGFARVVPLAGGPARTVARGRLPPGVREGDVVVDGRRDARRTAELRREVADLRRRLASPAGGIDLGRADAR